MKAVIYQSAFQTESKNADAGISALMRFLDTYDRGKNIRSRFWTRPPRPQSGSGASFS